MAGRSRLDKARGIRIVDSKSCGMNATDSKENGVEPLESLSNGPRRDIEGCYMGRNYDDGRYG